MQLTGIRRKQQELEAEYFDIEKKNSAGPAPTLTPEEIKVRKQAVDLLASHIAQAEELDRKGFTGDRDDLFSTLVPVTRVQPLSQDIEMRELPAEFLAQMSELDLQEDEIVCC